MTRRNWFGWAAGWCVALGASVAPTVKAQEPMFDPPVPYGMPMHQAGADPYWVSPIPERPQLFSSTDPFQSGTRDYEGFFIRTEYLNWNFSDPGSVLLGAPQFGVGNPRDPRQIFDTSVDPADFLGFASVPSLDGMRLEDNSGARATVGIPLIFGAFEASVMGFGKARELMRDDNMLGTAEQPFYGTSTLVNGVIDQNIYLYNESFQASFQSRLWSAEANIFLDGPSSNFFSLSPMLGFKYMDFSEDLLQTGVFNPALLSPPAVGDRIVSRIDSYSVNQMFLPQIGLRTKLETRFLTVTFDPKFGLGPNVYKNTVRTVNFRSNGDPLVETVDDSTQLVPMIDLGVNGQIHLTPNFSMTVGYNFIWASGVTRPQDNIRYNDNGPLPTLPGVVVDTHRQDMKWEGLSIGGQLRF